MTLINMALFILITGLIHQTMSASVLGFCQLSSGCCVLNRTYFREGEVGWGRSFGPTLQREVNRSANFISEFPLVLLERNKPLEVFQAPLHRKL